MTDNRFDRPELDWLIYNKPLEYAALVLNGGIVEYCKSSREHRGLRSETDCARRPYPPLWAGYGLSYFRLFPLSLALAVGLIRPRLSALADRAFHMSPLDTRQGKDLMGSFIADLELQILTFVAQSELIRKRQAEGIAATKSKGVRFGRPPRPLPESFYGAYQRWKAGSITGTAAAKECGIPLATFRCQAESYQSL